ncbi:unnamed protein product [Didymodactylos carnosus]|uniref:Retrotransposon gag domain-containing protein n=1 Tax=Didymodactylos carnosus TaxID=1234261 RepID=A0A813TD31_9BILA|nr:unnamed protein product [Didymodactylos carnosus]CAF0837951.1 unnamed protein product [Didymodactylos carnosus]CAF3598676.1 unnamed protein product [Didymodactylos carnosus]CAF3622841.1 unnamed protein product [Didymodactylos carnosus]
MKFKCVPTLLQDEVMKWYKRKSATITSWSEFEKQIKEFTSKFKNCKAFERLLHYEQSMNQSIKDYYNEIMDLCKQADPQMSETIKLPYLLTKVKPILKLEVSKKFPEAPADFLNCSKQLEELMEFMKDDPTTVSVASAPQSSTSSRIHASINRNDQRLYVPPPRRFEQQQESNKIHHLMVNRSATPLPSPSQTSRNNPSQSSNAAANSQSNQRQHNLYYSRSAYPTPRPPQNYSGCYSCQRFNNCRIRDDQRQIHRDLQQYASNDVSSVLAIVRERDRYKQRNNRRIVSTINLAPSPPEQLMDYENPPETELQPQQRISALVCESISITGTEMSRMVHVDEALVSVLPSHCRTTQPKRLRRKPRRRSKKSRLNSNKKASKRHRKTDFKYELVKPIDPQFHPTQVRRILSP